MIDEKPEIIEVPLVLEEDDVWRVLGAKDRVVTELQSEVCEAIDEVSKFSIPLAIFQKVEVDTIEPKRVKFRSGAEVSNKFAAHLFQGAEEAFFVVATVGPDIDYRISQLITAGDNVEAIVMDAVGTAAAFNTFTYVLDSLLSRTVSRDWKMGTCLRPGQSYWDISGQSVIFESLSAEKIGVKLLSSSFMTPQKSQSGIVPIGPYLKIEDDPSNSYCRYCKASRCPMRVEPFDGVVKK